MGKTIGIGIAFAVGGVALGVGGALLYVAKKGLPAFMAKMAQPAAA